MGDNLFVSFVERVARVAQYARNNYSMWWNGKEYPWDKKRGKFMRWSGGNNPYPEEPGYEESNPLFAASGIFPEKEETKNTDVPKSEQKSEEKPLPPMTTNHPTSQKGTEPIVAESAEDFQKVVDIERSKTMSPEVAEREKTKTRDFVAGMREYITNNIEYRKLEKRRQELREQIKQGGDILWIADADKENKEIVSQCHSFKEYITLFKSRIETRINALSDKEREQNLAFLRAAFPDRGGFSFFSPSFKEETLAKFRKLGKEKDAQYVFNVFDIIGKSFNFNRKTAKQPTLNFRKIPRFDTKSVNNSGDLIESRYDRVRNYDRYSGKDEGTTISLSVQEEHRNGLMKGFALRLGEWLDEEVLGLKQMEENQDWLQRETGDYHTPTFGKEYTIPQEKAPFLCVDPEGVSMTVAHPHIYPESSKHNHIIFNTGVFPTGMQWLAIYPEMFAIQSPKHFNQLLKNFKAISAKTRKS